MINKNKYQEVVEKLEIIGVNKEQSKIYLELWTKGPATVVQLSRRLSLGRNVVYRVLGELKELNLVNQVKSQNVSKFEALNYRNLQTLVDKKEEDYKSAQKNLSKLFDEFSNLQSASKVSSNVIHYYGIDGLKQVNWNLVHTKGMYRVYEVSRLSEYLDWDFAEKLRAEWLRRKIYSRDLTNDTKIEAHTNINEFMDKYSEYRHIDPKVLKIETEVYIYNDVVTVLEYDNMEYDPASIFCVEVRNQALADIQKQIYDIIWEQARPLVICGEHGERKMKDLKK